MFIFGRIFEIPVIMKAFLLKLAEEIYRNHHTNFDKLCVVLPSRRAGLFLKKHLAGLITKPLWLPDIFTIDDFIEELTSTKISDQIDVLFQLYEIHKLNLPAESELNPENFLRQGMTMINDFDTIDKSLSNPSEIYNYLTKAKKIELWNPGKPELTEAQQKYLQFFESQFNYYSNLKQRLQEKSMAYPGMLYREVSEKIEREDIQLKWDKVFFAGFNALSKSEEQILLKLRKMQKAEIFWDADQYYMERDYMEAGLYLRKFRSIFPDFHWIDSTLTSEKKDIMIMGIPSDIGMAKLTGQVIYNNFVETEGKEGENSVIALADETLLIPVLNSLPPQIGRCNVTMGYPYTSTHIHELIKLLMNIRLKNEEQQRIGASQEIELIPSDLKKILHHPLIEEFPNRKAEKDEIVQGNVSKSGFKAHKIIDDPDLAACMLKCLWPDDTPEFIAGMLELVEMIFESLKKEMSEEITSPEMEFATITHKLLIQIRNFIVKYPEFDKPRTLAMIYNHLARGIKIPFYGEPLSGLQIMGMLETRALDFENVIIVSANEDILPRTRKSDTFLPLDIQIAFGIPTYKEQAAIYAYTFYRLIQKAKNVTIIYNAAEESSEVTEKSRFIRQITSELPKINPLAEIGESVIPITPDLSKSQFPIHINKNQDINKLLKERAKNGFSPTSLSRYIQCPLKFCLNDLLEVREPEEVDNLLDAATFGNIAHETLKRFYFPFKNQKLLSEPILENLTKLNRLVSESANQLKPGTNFKLGKNFLSLVAIEKLCEKVIMHDLDDIRNGIDIIITDLEQKFTWKISIIDEETNLDVLIKGTADRIQKEDQLTRIIDYKTGMVEQRELQVAEPELLTLDAKKHKALQLAIYEWLYLKNNPIQNEVVGSILPLKDISKSFLDLKISYPESEMGKAEQVEQEIIGLLNQIFDKNISFEQTPEIQNCKYCEFKTLCGRQGE